MNTFVIRKPLITEKSTDAGVLGKYVFIVSPSATKQEIKKAVRDIYKVDPTAVNIVNRPAKRKRAGGRIRGGKQRGHKKAIVTLKKGQKIDIQ